jgi:hypothetical protein
MAEIVATMVVGPLVSMLKEKASNYLLEQYNVMEGMEEQHKILKRKLPAILDVIADAEIQAAQHREGAKAWLEDVRKVAYLGNDVFDEFEYEALRRKAKEEGHYRNLNTIDVIKLFPTHNRLVFRYRMGNKLCSILQEIDVLVTEMNAFRFKFKPHQQLSMKGRQTHSNLVDQMEIADISRAEDKKKLVDTLLGQESNVHLTVLPIFGMGGLGKTTLAQLVFKDTKIKKHFQLLLWVCVSDNFDVDLLAKRIVDEAAATEMGRGTCLPDVVSGKRYLLVLDDVWNRDVSKWEKLKSILTYGGMGSCVLTTTRDKTIAEFMGTTEAHELGFLNKGFIEEIIKRNAFTSEKESHANDVARMVGDMAEKCFGSPLAATALGSVLHTRHSVEEWDAILKRKTICDEETGILPILKLSYNVLSSQMRQCFSFCAMFPKDYEIDVKMLIQLWMANGFILEEKEVCPEIRGKQIFNELLSRSFFQDVKKTDIMTCKIHDLMHDVAQLAMGEECATIPTEPSKSKGIPYSTRHLCVPSEYEKTVLEGFVQKSSPGLQTLFCTSGCADGELWFLSRYNSIRALKINEGRSSLFLKPKYLHHLRYLDLSGSYIESLPKDVSILYHLQTLNLSGCKYLIQLPKQIKYMNALRHLYTHGCLELKMMPPEFRCLTSLRTLTSFVAGTTGSSCSDLTELELLDLGDKLEVCRLENVTETEAQAANLENKKRLTELTLRWTDSESQRHSHAKVLEGLNPHYGIKVLSIFDYGGSTWPTWRNTCSKQSTSSVLPPCLESLHLSGCDSLVEVPTLSSSLRELYIYKCNKLESVIVRKQENSAPLQGSCSKPMPLPNLSLIINECDSLLSLSVKLDCTSLHISFCGSLKSPDGDLASLERLYLYGCGSLESIPDVPEAYSSMGDLTILQCHRLLVALPPCLKQQLNDIQDKYLDDPYTGNNELFFLRLLFYLQKCPTRAQLVYP